MPKEYHNLINVFSKSALDKLPPHRLYNHKIQLEGNLPIRYSPLYKQITKELQAIKEYITENLQKGFIKHSSAPFASPILFIKKPSKGLRFYINYQQLNNITKKDQYPLPLLDKTLAQINKAKVFTKLNIR
jgi:hypothetical protein